jgi:hypothetical protein
MAAMLSPSIAASAGAPPLRWPHLVLSTALAALSAACAFAAVAVSAYAGHPLRDLAAGIYALFGAGSGAGCALVQMRLAGVWLALPSLSQVQATQTEAALSEPVPAPRAQTPAFVHTQPAAHVALREPARAPAAEAVAVA